MHYVPGETLGLNDFLYALLSRKPAPLIPSAGCIACEERLYAQYFLALQLCVQDQSDCSCQIGSAIDVNLKVACDIRTVED
jgi:hypothetical protein